MPDIPAFDQTRPIEPPKVHYNSDSIRSRLLPLPLIVVGQLFGRKWIRKTVWWSGESQQDEYAYGRRTFVDETDWTSAPASVDMSEERTPYVQETELYLLHLHRCIPTNRQWRRCAAFSIQRALYSDFGKIRFDADRPAPGAVRCCLNVIWIKYVRNKVSQGVCFWNRAIARFEAAVLESSIMGDFSAVGFELTLGGEVMRSMAFRPALKGWIRWSWCVIWHTAMKRKWREGRSATQSWLWHWRRLLPLFTARCWAMNG